jgi:hypothetical protein
MVGRGSAKVALEDGMSQEGSFLGLALAALGKQQAEVREDLEVAEFTKRLLAFGHALLTHLPQDEAARKEPERIFAALEDLIELEAARPSPRRRAQIERAIAFDPEKLDRYTTREMIFALREILVRDGPPEIIYGMSADEQRWTKKTTSWLTWDQLFGAIVAPGQKDYLAGESPSEQDVNATRNLLMTLLRARLDDIEVHESRQAKRRRNLRVLSVVLDVVLMVLAFVVGYSIDSVGSTPAGLALAVVAGALGATLAGTLKARDNLARVADIESFRDGLPSQILVGAAAGLLVVIILASKLVSIAGLDAGSPAVDLGIGFLGGYSEPFFLGIVGRAAKLGDAPVDAT